MLNIISDDWSWVSKEFTYIKLDRISSCVLTYINCILSNVDAFWLTYIVLLICEEVYHHTI